MYTRVQNLEEIQSWNIKPVFKISGTTIQKEHAMVYAQNV